MTEQSVFTRELTAYKSIKANPDASSRALAEGLGCSHTFVLKMRRRIEAGEFDPDPAFAGPLTWRRPDLPKTPQEVRAVKERDIDDLISEVSKLMNRIDQLQDENAALRQRAA
jgi:hypothetical protein